MHQYKSLYTEHTPSDILMYTHDIIIIFFKITHDRLHPPSASNLFAYKGNLLNIDYLYIYNRGLL